MVTRFIIRARTVLALAGTAATVVAGLRALAAMVKNDEKALDDLEAELKKDKELGASNDSEDSSVEEKNKPQNSALVTAQAIQDALEYAAKLDQEAQDEVLEFIADVITNWKIPFAIQVTTLLFVTIGQYAALGNVLHKMMEKAAKSPNAKKIADQLRAAGKSAWNSIPTTTQVEKSFVAVVDGAKSTVGTATEKATLAVKLAQGSILNTIGECLISIGNACDNAADKLKK